MNEKRKTKTTKTTIHVPLSSLKSTFSFLAKNRTAGDANTFPWLAVVVAESCHCLVAVALGTKLVSLIIELPPQTRV
jgi:hypothetical protein